MSVVDLSNRPICAEIPADDTPVAVLEKLAAEIKDGKYAAVRIVIALESDAGYSYRSSRMTNAEAVTLIVVSTRLVVDGILDD